MKSDIMRILAPKSENDIFQYWLVSLSNNGFLLRVAETGTKKQQETLRLGYESFLMLLSYYGIWKFMTVSHHLTDLCEVSACTRVPVHVYASAHCPVCMCAWFVKKKKKKLVDLTVNVSRAALNLSKQHTPSWAAKRADRGNWGEKEPRERTPLG